MLASENVQIAEKETTAASASRTHTHRKSDIGRNLDVHCATRGGRDVLGILQCIELRPAFRMISDARKWQPSRQSRVLLLSSLCI